MANTSIYTTLRMQMEKEDAEDIVFLALQDSSLKPEFALLATLVLQTSYSPNVCRNILNLCRVLWSQQ